LKFKVRRQSSKTARRFAAGELSAFFMFYRSISNTDILRMHIKYLKTDKKYINLSGFPSIFIQNT